jgi:hypothetical protein
MLIILEKEPFIESTRLQGKGYLTNGLINRTKTGYRLPAEKDGVRAGGREMEKGRMGEAEKSYWVLGARCPL